MILTQQSPVPIKRIESGATILVTACKKCGNEIKTDITGMSREQVVKALERIDDPNWVGECPGGFHVEFGNWATTWGLWEAVEKHFNS